MKTLKDAMLERLQGNGLFPDQAEAVFKEAIADECMETMVGRWNDEASGYPEGLIVTSWMLMKPIAAKWIEKNCPQAWFRPMFAPGSETCKDGDNFVKNFWESVNGTKAPLFVNEYPEVDEGGRRQSVEERNG